MGACACVCVGGSVWQNMNNLVSLVLSFEPRIILLAINIITLSMQFKILTLNT